jgi:hydrogenase 3 maturation protease
MDNFAELERRLKTRIGSLPPEKVVFVGVGNRFRGDDAAGPMIIDMLKDYGLYAIDAGPTPEDVTGEVRRVMPKAVVFVDALYMKDLPPGAPEIAEIDEIRYQGGSTHTYSIDIVMEYLKKETHADVFMIGIQPAHIGEGEGLSPGMEKSLKDTAAAIVQALKQ